MKIVKFSLNIGFANAMVEDEIEIDDDITDKEIEEQFLEWKIGIIDSYWEIIK